MTLTHLSEVFTLIAYICFYASEVAAQNLTVPSEVWRKPTSNLSRASLEMLASEAAAPLSKADISSANPDLPELVDVTSVYAILAQQDYYRGNTAWRTLVTDGLQAMIQGKTHFYSPVAELSSDVNYWGLTFIYAFRAYNQKSLLGHAVDAWNLTYSTAYITLDEEASGSGAGRNISLVPPANCSGGTFAGGVFYYQDPAHSNNTFINAVSVAPFMALSAYLYEETNNATYQQAAQHSLDFIINHLWDGKIVYDNINSSSCESVKGPWTVNQAWFVEGLSVWANITGNDTLTKLLETVVPSVATFPDWISSTSDGIINDHTRDTSTSLNGNQQILKGILVRGLAEARMRNPGTDLARYIEAFIFVQLNAVLDFSRAPAPNNSYYARSWDRSPASSFDAGGNVAAIDVLNSAFTLVSPSTSASDALKGHATLGAIIGGVVGGVIAVVTAIAVVVLCRRQRNATDISEDDKLSGADSVEPFFLRIAHNPSASESSKSGRVNEDARPHQAPLPAPASDETHDQSIGHEPIEVAEIPSLVQRLNNFLQGRHGEPPPRYDE
ncbi:hypothetical protein PENSPDRAFT_320110 [Peniophora sp. CONT]|nr:hypothetical protein PENSPDRAFT_320110 [Peniophora sp. CONT]